MTDFCAEPMTEATAGVLLELARAMGDEDGHPLDAGGEAAVYALAKGDPFARAWLLRAKTDTGADSAVVGYVVLTLGFSIEYGGRDGFMDELYVVPDARGRGVGTAAVRLVMDEARKLGFKALHLEVMPGNERALELYRRHGFTDTRRHLLNKWL